MATRADWKGQTLSTRRADVAGLVHWAVVSMGGRVNGAGDVATLELAQQAAELVAGVRLVELTFPMGGGRSVTVPGVGPVLVEVTAADRESEAGRARVLVLVILAAVLTVAAVLTLEARPAGSGWGRVPVTYSHPAEAAPAAPCRVLVRVDQDVPEDIDYRGSADGRWVRLDGTVYGWSAQEDSTVWNQAECMGGGK